jgi:hypothetical protein
MRPDVVSRIQGDLKSMKTKLRTCGSDTDERSFAFFAANVSDTKGPCLGFLEFVRFPKEKLLPVLSVPRRGVDIKIRESASARENRLDRR